MQLLLFGKWIFSSIVLQKDAITPAIKQFLFRANGGIEDSYGGKGHILKNRWDGLVKNFQYYFNKTAIAILCVVVIIWIVAIIFKRKKLKEIGFVIPLLIIALFPYVWYLILAEHSLRHAFFTFRIQSITSFALLSAMGMTIKNSDKEN